MALTKVLESVHGSLEEPLVDEDGADHCAGPAFPTLAMKSDNSLPAIPTL